jgi:hypothetical protein
MTGTETFTAQVLKETADAIAKELGPGSFTQACEVKGVVACDKPLTSDIKHLPCVYFRSLVTQEFKEVYYERDSQGREHRRTRSRTETVSDLTRSIEFYVEDGTGRTLVSPEGAALDCEQVANETRPGQAPLINISFGPGSSHFVMRHQEWILPVGRRVYVLGEARDQGGALSVRKPEKGGKYLISLKSEEELTQSALGSVKIFGVLAPLCLGLGAISLLLGLFL